MISGAFDTLSHAMETYFGNSDQDNVSDDVALAIMRNTVVNMKRLMGNINDMQARGSLMWDSAMAENGILKVGRVTDFQASSTSWARTRTAITGRDWLSSIRLTTATS